ncbi:MAG: GNAT family N-acetyltransferase [Gemmatimonadetes bacterium]|nr:GNAT family N-acetyltransferase [Gemmatimonadota bacterium]
MRDEVHEYGSDALTIREAVERDVPDLVTLLADDPLGSQREAPGPEQMSAYQSAFQAIVERADHTLLVADRGGRPVAVLQLSFLPHLTYTGGWRAQIEGVRVCAELRATGLGRRLLEEAIDRARDRGCHLVQLTTDARRPAARAFYERLGFQATHHGMKMHLVGSAPGDATTLTDEAP